MDSRTAKATIRHAEKERGNLSVKSNSLSKTRKSLNCLLTVEQARDHARHLVELAQLIEDSPKLKEAGAAVHIYNAGLNSETIGVGLNKARKGPRRRRA